jgi:hypothetical protein
VYKCILKLNQVDQEEVMYFTSHILIGNSAEVEILRNSLHDKTKKHVAQDTLDIYL